MGKQDYNKIKVKDNMNVEADVEEVEVSREKKEPLKKVVDVQPKKVKHSLLSRLVTGILGPEGLPGIGAYVNDEIVKPAIKNIIFDAITSAASMAMFGEKGGPIRGRGYADASRRSTGYKPATNYASRYESRSQPEPPRDRLMPRGSRQRVEEYIIEDRFAASDVLVNLKENADRYDVVSVADYYDLIGVTSADFTDNNYGWTIDSIVHATIVPVRGGYIIKFPPVEVIG